MKHLLVLVEGAHDQAFVERCFHVFLNFNKIPNCEKKTLTPKWRDEHSFWFGCFPCKYPSENGKIYERLAFPSILMRDDTSIGVYAAGGFQSLSSFRAYFEDILRRGAVFDAVGVVADADNKIPSDVQQEIRDAFGAFTKDGGFYFDAYIFPDNKNKGVLDTLLCRCGEAVYEPLMAEGRAFLQRAEEVRREIHDWKGFASYDCDKALVASVVSVLKPGKTNTASLSDNQWVSLATKEKLIDVIAFFERLLDNAH